MITVSSAAAAALDSTSRTFRARYLIDGKEVAGDVRSVTVYKGSCGGTQFVPGSIFCPYIETTIDGCSTVLTGKELQLQFGILVGETVAWTGVGYFTAEKPTSSVHSTTFTAVGRLSSKMGGLYSSTLTYPASIAAVLQEISWATGVPIDASGFDRSGKIEVKPTGYMYREMIAYIAGIFLGYATEDARGRIVFRRFGVEEVVKTDGDRTTTEPTFEDYDTEITGIKVVVEGESDEDESEAAFVSGTPNVAVSNPFMTQALFAKNTSNLVGYRYRPGTVKISLGDYRIEPFDTLHVTDSSGTTRSVPCMSVVHTFDGGLTTEVVAPGLGESDGEGSFRGRLGQIVERMTADLITAKQLIANKITADEADLRYASIEKLDADVARITEMLADKVSTGELTAERAEIDDLLAARVRVDRANIDYAWIQGLLVDGHILTDDIAGTTGQFTKYLTGVKIVGDIIDAKTITADKIIVRDPDGNTGLLYELNNGIVEQKDLSAEELQRLTLNGSIITAESITADKINVTDLFAQNIEATGTIDGATLSQGHRTGIDGVDGSYFGGEGFALGEALVYNAKTKELSIRADSLNIGPSTVATRTDVDKAIEDVKPYLHIRYSAVENPTAEQMTIEADEDTWWMGMCHSARETAPTDPTVYEWVRTKGNEGGTGQRGEDAVLLRVDSSRGVVFKNNMVSTVLSVAIYYGSLRITTAAEMAEAFGSGARLEWEWQRIDEDRFGILSAEDGRLSDSGFHLMLSPEDVDVKVTFRCNLVID